MLGAIINNVFLDYVYRLFVICFGTIQDWLNKEKKKI